MTDDGGPQTIHRRRGESDAAFLERYRAAKAAHAAAVAAGMPAFVETRRAAELLYGEEYKP